MLKDVLIGLFSALFWWFSIGFITLEWDPSFWDKFDRFLLMYLGVFTPVMLCWLRRIK